MLIPFEGPEGSQVYIEVDSVTSVFPIVGPIEGDVCITLGADDRYAVFNTTPEEVAARINAVKAGKAYYPVRDGARAC